MKINTTKAAIISATKIVESAVAGGDESVLASHFLFRVVDGVVHILGSNGKRLLASAVVADAVVEGDPTPFTVSSWRFTQLINMSPDGACTMDFDGASTKVSINKRTIRFASLDPSAFPYWDSVLEGAPVTATIKAGRLFSALSFIKPFVSTLDTRTPALTSTECRSGTFWATDSQSLAMANVAGLAGSTIRIHHSDISPVNAFLGLDADLDITIREHETTMFFVRPDGGVFGVSRWTHPVPAIKFDDSVKCSFTVDVESVRYGLRFLSVATAKGDDRLRFDFRDGKVFMSVDAVAGGREEYEVQSKDLVDIDVFLNSGRTSFDINTNHLTAVLASASGADATFGVNWTPKNGYILHRQGLSDGGQHTAVVTWRK